MTRCTVTSLPRPLPPPTGRSVVVRPRRYVVHGSRYLARVGCELVGFDARGHGASSPAPERSAYEYADMVGDLRAVLGEVDGDVVLVGNSMGAGTACAYALAEPARVDALVLVTPGFSG